MARAENGNTIFKVIEAQDLENHTHNGWNVDQVLSESKIDYGTEQVAVPNNGYISRESVSKAFAVTRNTFLVSRRENSQPAIWEATIAELKQKLQEKETAATDAKRELEKKDKEIATLKEQYARLDEVNKGNYKQYAEQRDRNQKMEGDIAKIRSAIGALKMKEILAQ